MKGGEIIKTVFKHKRDNGEVVRRVVETWTSPPEHGKYHPMYYGESEYWEGEDSFPREKGFDPVLVRRQTINLERHR
ncbi:MAG: hypothetical protein ACXABY_11200 [Candidatus Thorarchaeota archaeon]|jgi:hypothetical protein